MLTRRRRIAIGHLARVALDMAEVAANAGRSRRYGSAALDEGNPLLDGMLDGVWGINAGTWQEDMSMFG